MRTVVIALGLLLAVSAAEAGSFTVTTTTEQDAAMVALLRKTNAERPTPLTAKEYRDYLVAQWLDGLVTQAGTQSTTSVREAWEKADQAKRDQVKSILGVQ
jgi:nanoRNase/pAp phosphatase (c-di-AMP/oligoRNAs hydrolase)